jgi:hypothetical protein
LLYPITSEDWAGFLITIKASDARLPKSRGMRRTRWYAAVTRDEGNAADDVLMVDQGGPEYLPSQRVWLILSPVPTEAPPVCDFERFTTWEASLLFRNSQSAGASPAEPQVYLSEVKDDRRVHGFSG